MGHGKLGKCVFEYTTTQQPPVKCGSFLSTLLNSEECMGILFRFAREIVPPMFHSAITAAMFTRRAHPPLTAAITELRCILSSAL